MTTLIGSTEYNTGPYGNAELVPDNVVVAPGRAILINVSSAASVTLTLTSGATVAISLPVGSSIYQFAVINAHTTAGTVSSFYNLN